jgi:hypothetical protein
MDLFAARVTSFAKPTGSRLESAIPRILDREHFSAEVDGKYGTWFATVRLGTSWTAPLKSGKALAAGISK